MVSVRVRLNPADISVFAPVNHVELARRAILEHQCRRVAQIHQHYGVRYTRFGNIDAGFGDDRRELRFGVGFRARTRKNRISCIFDIGLSSFDDLMFFETVGVTPQLSLDTVCSAVECKLWLAPTMGSFEHHSLDNWSNDVAGVIIVRAASEGDIGSYRTRKIFLCDFGDP